MKRLQKDMPVGYMLASDPRTMTLERMDTYCNKLISVVQGKAVKLGKNIHNDDEFAQAQGLEKAIADGMISTAWLSDMLVDAFGEGYIRGGKLMTKYIRSVYNGDVLTMKMKVTEKTLEENAVRFSLDVWCENQDGQVVTVGAASALVK